MQPVPQERDTRDVEGYCTCGAKTVENALFCHRCGRPLRELAVEAEEPKSDTVVLSSAAEAAAADLLPEALAPVSLKNGNVVRVAVMTAMLAHIVTSVVAASGLLPLVPVLILVFGGVAAVLYARRSGAPLSVFLGARMGWIMGLFWFLIATVFFTISLSLQASSVGIQGFFQKSFEAMGTKGPELERALEMLNSPTTIIIMIVFALAFEFLFLTLIGSFGGALAARLLHRKTN